MLAALIPVIVSFFSSDKGGKVGDSIANGVSLVALAPVVLWVLDNKDGAAVAFAFTWGQLAFVGVLLFFLVKLVHYTRSPGGGG